MIFPEVGMVAPAPIHDLLARLAQGDEAAVRQFVDRYEPYLRRAIRPRLARAGLRAAADSADVCQSVFGNFLIRLASREFDIRSTADLERLLFGMARKKFATLARREYAQRRDRSRAVPLLAGHDQSSRADDPGAVASARDLLDQVCRRLPGDARALLAERQAGRSWDEIAGATGEAAGVLRKRLSRALHRVAVDLGLEEGDG